MNADKHRCSFLVLSVFHLRSLVDSTLTTMKKFLKIALIALAVIFVALQFKQPDRTNPPENPADTLEARLNVPADVKAVLDRSCADCHTNRTSWPFYSYIAPMSWFVADHVHEGRRELNFSVWGTYEPRRQRRKLNEICEQVESGAMPLESYLIIHRNAKLAPEEAQLLCTWAKAEEAKLPAPNAQPSPAQK